MQVSKTYFIVMKKQLPSIIIYGVIFLALVLALTFSVFNKEAKKKEFTAAKTSVMLINEDSDSSFVKNFITYLEGYVNFKEIGEGEEAKKDALFVGTISYILTIPKGFTEDILAGRDVVLTKQVVPNSATAITVDTAVDNYINTAMLYIKYFPESNIEDLNTRINNSLNVNTPVTVESKRGRTEIVGDVFNSYYFNYLGYIIISCFIIGISTVMFAFSGLEIRRKHFSSPLTNKSYNLQLILANLVFVTCYVVVFILAGYISNTNRKIDANLLLTWLNVFLFALTVLSISYLIGITVKGKNAVQAISTMLSLSLAFISGMFVPQQFLGDSILRVASFTPAYWYVKVNNTIADLTNISFNSLSDVFAGMVIQIGFAAAIISIALVVNKRKRQQAF